MHMRVSRAGGEAAEGEEERIPSRLCPEQGARPRARSHDPETTTRAESRVGRSMD